MLHHLQVWRTHLSGSGWEHTFQPTILSTFISPLSPSFLLTFPHHLPPAPTPFPPPSSLSGRAQRRGDNVKYRNKLWSLIGVAVKKFWCPKKKQEKKKKGKNLQWLGLAEPSWFQGWVSHVKPRAELCSKTQKRPFLPSVFSFASCAKLQLSRTFM